MYYFRHLQTTYLFCLVKYLFVLFVEVCVLYVEGVSICAYVSVQRMHTCVCKYAGLGGGQTSSSLLHNKHSPSHILKIWSLTEPRAMLATSKHQLPPISASTHIHDVRLVGSHVQLFIWVLGSQPKMSCHTDQWNRIKDPDESPCTMSPGF